MNETINPNWFLKARLKTRQLLLLIAVDDHRNINRAADELSISQPAASKQIKDLENMLDARLFHRLPRGIIPTLHGEIMIRHARMALKSLALAHDDIISLKAGLIGQVRIGVIMTPAMSLLPRAIARVKQRAPKMRIGVELEPSNVLLDKLRHGALDFMIGRVLDKHAIDGLGYEELTEEPTCAVVRLGHPLLARSELSLADLVRLPWILPAAGSALRQRFDKMFRSAGLDVPSNVVDSTALLLITALLQHTESIHVMPRDVAHYYAALDVLRVLPVEMPCQMDAFGIIWQAARTLSPCAEVMLGEVRRAAGEIYRPTRAGAVPP